MSVPTESIPNGSENPVRHKRARRRLALWALLLLVPAPSLGVFVAMVWRPTEPMVAAKAIDVPHEHGLSHSDSRPEDLSSNTSADADAQFNATAASPESDGDAETSPWAKGFYFFMKVWILVLPVAWTWFIDRRRFTREEMHQTWATFGRPADGLRPIVVGAVLGLGIAAAIFGAYFVVRDSLIDPEAMRAMASNNGIGTPGSFLLFTALLSTVNAWLEEYVWRWFVFRKCETLVGGRIAIVLSALLFTGHHILALICQASWQVTALACLGVFIGGCVWSWCFLRYRSIWPGYVSHVIADVAVFTVGYLILFG